MIKENSIVTSSLLNFDYNNSLYSAKLNFYQDTLRNGIIGSSSVLKVSRPNLTVSDSLSVDRQHLDKLYQSAEARDRTLSTQKITSSHVVKDTSLFEGSTTRVYSDYIPLFQKLPDYNAEGLNKNILLNIAEKTIDIHYKTNDSVKNINTSTVSIIPSPKVQVPSGFEGKIRNFETNGWYIFVLLISISIFAWGKSLYQKYLLQIINSVYNYQISVQLFRDKNALFRNLSFILQVLSPINLGLLIYFLIDFYHFEHILPLPIANIAFYSFSVFLFFRLKNFLYKFLGVLFKVEEEFHEIQHHMNVFVQTLGVALLPFVISMPFLADNLKNAFMFALFLITGLFTLLFFFRGFQIVSRKQVPFFFLILYLCAVEILPVVLLVKTSYSMI